MNSTPTKWVSREKVRTPKCIAKNENREEYDKKQESTL